MERLKINLSFNYLLVSMSFSLIVFYEVHGLLVARGVDIHADDDAPQLAEPQRCFSSHAVTCSSYLKQRNHSSFKNLDIFLLYIYLLDIDSLYFFICYIFSENGIK